MRSSVRAAGSPSLFRTTGTLGLAAALSRLCNLGVIAALARGAGSSAVGVYGIATLVGSFAALATSLGLGTYATRERAAGSLSAQRVSAIHLGRLVLTIAAACAIWAVGRQFMSGPTAVGFFGFAAAVLLDQWNETAWALIRGTTKAHREALVNASTYGALLGVALTLLATGRLTFTLLGLVAALAAVARSTLACVVSGVAVSVSPRASADALSHEVRHSLPYMASDVLGLAYLRGDTLVLSLFVSTSALGEYVAAAALTSPLVQVASAMSLGALATAATRVTGEARESAVVGLFTRTGLAIAAALSLLLPVIVRMLYGSSHETVVALAGILTLFLPLRFLNFGLSSLVLARGMVLRRLHIVIAGVAVNVVLNLALDPFIGATGAAWATVLTEVGVTCAFLLVLERARLWGIGAAVIAAVTIAGVPLLMSGTSASSARPTLASGILLSGCLLLAVASRTRARRLLWPSAETGL
jgi:O-antigen/teichoic acid export membrane protein